MYIQSLYIFHKKYKLNLKELKNKQGLYHTIRSPPIELAAILNCSMNEIERIEWSRKVYK